MNKLSKLYIIGIDAAAIAAAIAMPHEGLVERTPALFTLIALAALTGARSVQIPRLNLKLTPGDVFTFCALPIVGPLGAVLVAFASTLSAVAPGKKRPKPMQVAFNLGALPLSAAAAAVVWQILPAAGSTGMTGGLLALLVAAAAFLIVNGLLVGLMLRLHNKTAFFPFWARAISLSFGPTLLSLLAAVGLAAFIEITGPVGLALGLFVSAELVRAFRAREGLMDDAATS
ncbi:MAG: hypothetical protein OEV00_02815 [Acidobacteriota bacterium]|nr:hypothetical protein [Acidobacteriota bacterium]MDH3784242.1 hypothetical protein [Acidobacteriota bacterium]